MINGELVLLKTHGALLILAAIQNDGQGNGKYFADFSMVGLPLQVCITPGQNWHNFKAAGKIAWWQGSGQMPLIANQASFFCAFAKCSCDAVFTIFKFTAGKGDLSAVLAQLLAALVEPDLCGAMIPVKRHEYRSTPKGNWQLLQ